MNDLLLGNNLEYLGVVSGLIPRSSASKFVLSDRFSNVGYWSDPGMRAVWNFEMNYNTPMVVQPNVLPGWWGIPFAPLNYNFPCPGAPWVPVGDDRLTNPNNNKTLYLHWFSFRTIWVLYDHR
jgi:hypothetical protein